MEKISELNWTEKRKSTFYLLQIACTKKLVILFLGIFCLTKYRLHNSQSKFGQTPIKKDIENEKDPKNKTEEGEKEWTRPFSVRINHPNIFFREPCNFLTTLLCISFTYLVFYPHDDMRVKKPFSLFISCKY